MGLFDKIEQQLEKAVRKTFSKDGAEFEPVDLANRVRTELDNTAYSDSSGRVLAPNIFTFHFAPEDFPKVTAWGEPLAEELCDVAIRHVRTQGFTLRGAVRVFFTTGQNVEPGTFELKSTQEGTQPRQAATPGRARPSSPPYAQNLPQRISRPDADRTQAMVPPAPVPVRPRAQVVLNINGQNYSVRSLPVVLGRGSHADITVEDSGVSRRHLEIMEQDGTYLAVDLGSTNGSFHNRERLLGRRALSHGDQLSIGNTTIIFKLMVPKEGR